MEKSKRLILFIGFILIVLVKLFIRPFVTLPPALFICRDVAPNLISAFLIPFCGDLFLKRWIQLIEKRSVLFICGIGMVILVLNELAQLFPVFHRTFDYFDILFSFIGVALGYFVFIQFFICSKTEKLARE